MLKLENISKNYYVGNQTIHALHEVSLQFRKNEFVAILGPSGCGKTTLLNIIGGLDRYTSGDLIINHKSTRHFNASDWDAYRNHSIGFVFQTYNLIPHLSVLKNVELAPTLAGVSPSVRKQKAITSLQKVGLGDQIHKYPNQLSGGQMQRVSIARALVNDPDIILADEPTGALDSKTSVQIVNILKEISKERLVIMVTHNEHLAETYATRIIKLLDGYVIDDNNPYFESEGAQALAPRLKTSMSLTTALGLSGRNLWTKKMRTLLTAFAASIGIIGIALILALSSGFSDYVDQMQSETLLNYPITISPRPINLEAYLNDNQEIEYEEFPDTNKIYPYLRHSPSTHYNTLSPSFEEHVNNLDPNLFNAIAFEHDVSMHLMSKVESEYFYLPTGTIRWSELLNSSDFMTTKYDVIAGDYPVEFDEIALVIDKYNRIHKTVLAALRMDYEVEYYQFEDFIGKEFRLIGNDLYYELNEGGYFSTRPVEDYPSIYESEDAIPLRITGILRLNPDNTTEFFRPGIVYTPTLTDYVLENSGNSEIGKAQVSYGIEKDVLTGKPFVGNLYTSAEEQLKARLQLLGVDKSPSLISIYPKSFEAKDQIKAHLDQFNIGKPEEEQVIYDDLAELISMTVGKMVNAITYVLIAFSSISLVVSSIMIGIITYVSVIERTKEIGVLRSLGARKKDIARVFNAETIIIGFTAGSLGILIAMLLTIPMNRIIYRYTQVADVAGVKWNHAVLLIGISMILTLIAGFIPSWIASRKDPVVALRTE